MDDLFFGDWWHRAQTRLNSVFKSQTTAHGIFLARSVWETQKIILFVSRRFSLVNAANLFHKKLFKISGRSSSNSDLSKTHHEGLQSRHKSEDWNKIWIHWIVFQNQFLCSKWEDSCKWDFWVILKYQLLNTSSIFIKKSPFPEYLLVSGLLRHFNDKNVSKPQGGEKQIYDQMANGFPNFKIFVGLYFTIKEEKTHENKSVVWKWHHWNIS